MNRAAEIRLLAATDVKDFRKMLSMFGRAFENAEGYESKQPDDAYLTRLLASDAFVALVATDGPQVVGGIAGYVLPKFEQARSELFVYDLAVDESYRRQGIATAMINRLRSYATERGIGGIFVPADCEDEPAVALYSTFSEPEEVLHFDLSPGSPPTAAR